MKHFQYLDNASGTPLKRTRFPNLRLRLENFMRAILGVDIYTWFYLVSDWWLIFWFTKNLCNQLVSWSYSMTRSKKNPYSFFKSTANNRVTLDDAISFRFPVQWNHIRSIRLFYQIEDKLISQMEDDNVTLIL